MKANIYKVLCSILFICAILINQQAKAQDTTTIQTNPVKRVSYVNDDFPRLKWDISTDLRFLLRDNYGQGDILVRYNKTKRKKNWGLQYTAYRYRLELSHRKTDREDLGDFITKEELEQHGGYYRNYVGSTELQSTYLGFALGHEWQQYYGRFMIHYGADVKFGRSVGETEHVEYYISNYDREVGEPHKIYKTSSLISFKSISFALAPVFGMRYFVHPMISITAETQLSAGYELRRIEADDNHYLYYYKPLDSKTETTFINHTPISLLGVTFHIGK